MKHLTFDDRLQIQKLLTVKSSFTVIAGEIKKNRTTISREVKAYARGEGRPSRSKCVHNCIFKNKADCPVPTCQKRECSVVCAQCAKYCDRYEPAVCERLLKPPYVCNGCDKRGDCHLDKKLYDAEYAHKQYKATLSESREGITLSEVEINHIADTVIPLVKKGISVPVAYDAYSDSMPVSDRTIYAYIDKGVFEVDNTDLRRKVQRKAGRKKSGPVLHVDKKCHVNRTYADFEIYVKEHPDINICEMDSVEGKKGGKVLLTIYFRNCSLQLLYLRERNDSASVTEVFRRLRRELGGEDFMRLFPLILADRGTEFSNPSVIEINTRTMETETRIFYCDPQQINQKSRCERNHEEVRYIFPKGKSLDGFTEEDIRTAMNHINSMPRGSLSYKSPIDLFIYIYGQETASKLGLVKIPLEELCLKPELLKK